MTDLSDYQMQLVDGMIEDIKRMPVFQLVVLKEKAFDNFKSKWKQRCLEGQVKTVNSPKFN